jgi:MFS transporter, DHA1 family, multidrug resistance protein
MTVARPTGARRIELIALFGALTAFAPLSTDMYLPSLPAITHDFHTGIGDAEHTLTAFFCGFAIGQAVFGPLADRFGRRGPLLWGLGIYVVACLLGAAASGIPSLIVLRFVQAVTACAGTVIARASVRDLFAPEEVPRIFSVMMLVMGVAPLLAPLVGGYVQLWFGWRAVFAVQGALGLTGFCAALLRLPESHAGPRRTLDPATVLIDYGRVARDRRFIGFALATATSHAGLFSYITASPHVFIDLFHVAAQHFGFFFGANAVALMAGSQIARLAMRRWRAETVLTAVQAGQAAGAAFLLLCALTGFGGLWGIAFGLMIYVGLNGAVVPTGSGLAMRAFARNAGMASALLGTLQFGLATVTSLIIGAIAQTSAVPMAAAVALCGVSGLLFNLLLSPRAVHAPAERG